MQVILLKEVEKLGDQGETVRVKDGYARNYLIPHGLAVPLGTGKAKHLSHRKKLVDDRRRREMKEAEKVATDLSEVSVEIAVHVGEEDKLYGSVTNADIAAALAQKGFEIERRKIEIEEPIKALGVYSVKVHVGPEMVATPKVWVVKAPPSAE
jgi:large subunit ribosomal protein L9